MNSSEYANEIMKQSIVRASGALGFKNVQKAALESLADIMENYIQTIAHKAKEQTEISDRSIVGIQDVIPILDSMRPKHTSSKELLAFALKGPYSEEGSNWSQPFPIDISEFPIINPKSQEGFTNIVNNSHQRDLFIPSHLPPYPPIHTYKKPTSNKKRPNDSLIQQENNSLKVSRKRINDILQSAQSSLAVIEETVDGIDKAQQN
eukprot:gene12016-16085_t